MTPARPARILVVDDNRDIVFVLESLLTHLGHTVLIARDGAEAIAMATCEPPDLVLLDLDMPVVDGWEACRRLRAMPKTRNLAIVAMSAHALIGDQEKALTAGLDDFISKPFDPVSTVEKISQLLAKAQGHQEMPAA
ncbi:MAG: response regulator [Candidatus Sumerlaeia bacterium]|nr:response regulator [Candidatus Sumerlaeia bacterium]